MWTALATQYQSANDTANTLEAFKQMLRVAPTNQKLREELFKYFLQSGHPETALQVADEGLKLDPYNADLYDLKSNACLFLSDFKCAVDALETLYATDSTKADTLFFTKISAAAAEGQKPDTARLLKWSQIGVRKYPDNPTLLGYLNKAYTMTGQDGQRGRRDQPTHGQGHVSRRARPGARPRRSSMPSGRRKPCRSSTYAIKHGDPQAKENAAALLYTGAAPLLQQPPGSPGCRRAASDVGRRGEPGGKVGPAANYLLGLATLFQVPQIDPQAEKGKSCDLAKQEDALLAEAETALTAGRNANPDAVDKNLGIIKKYKPRVAAMMKAYCK